jgi:hypothetical protein
MKSRYIYAEMSVNIQLDRFSFLRTGVLPGALARKLYLIAFLARREVAGLGLHTLDYR